VRKNGGIELAAVTGPNYGRIWNADVAKALRDRFGDGVTGQFTVPGEFGKAVDEVTKANTTLFAGERDMFVFLADEKNRIEVPNRRNGEAGEMARGFFVWNSEVGSQDARHRHVPVRLRVLQPDRLGRGRLRGDHGAPHDQRSGSLRRRSRPGD
jgi:hypothetical protein